MAIGPKRKKESSSRPFKGVPYFIISIPGLPSCCALVSIDSSRSVLDDEQKFN